MKKTILMLLLMCTAAMARAIDIRSFGYKGRVLDFTIEQHTSGKRIAQLSRIDVQRNASGTVTAFTLIDYRFTDLQQHYGSISGRFFCLSDRKVKGNFTGELDGDGQITRINFTYGNEDASIDITYYESWQMQDIDLSVINRYTGISFNSSIRFTDYRFDRFQNWTYRRVHISTDVEYTTYDYYETQTLAYPANYAEELEWEQALNSGDLNQVARVAQNSPVQQIRQRATEHWNRRSMEQLREQQYSRQALLEVMNAPLTTEENARQCEQIFNNRYVNPVNDFAALRQLKDEPRLPDRLRQAISEKADRCYADSMAHLTQAMEQHYAAHRYADCIAKAQEIKLIEPDNKRATHLIQEATYNQLTDLEAAGTVSEHDYEQYLSQNATSPHYLAVADRRANMVYEQARQSDNISEYRRLRTLPMSTAISTTLLPLVDKRIEKMERRENRSMERMRFRQNRGSFFHMQFGGGMEFGSPTLSAYGEVNMRLGWHVSIVNLLVGLKFNSLTDWGNIWGSDVTTSRWDKKWGHGNDDNPYIIARKLSIPVMLRLNYKHHYRRSSFLGLGAEYNMPVCRVNVNGMKYPHQQYLNPNNKISPRLSLGWSGRAMEFELYMIYNLKPEFRKLNHIAPVDFNHHLWSNDSKHKIRGGFKLSVGF